MSDEQVEQTTFQKLQVVFPEKAYKELSFSGYKMTTIDAYHIVERMTDVFGLCGEGWGFHDLKFEQHGDNNVSCIGAIWYTLKNPTDPGQAKGDPGDIQKFWPQNAGVVHAVGDAVVRQGNVAEAYKKAQTNLLSKASSFIGIGLSVYKGEGHDDPYNERAGDLPIPPQPPAPAAAPPAQQSPPAQQAPPSQQESPPAQEAPPPAAADGSMPVCSVCGTNESVIKGKEEWGGGYVCWVKHDKRPGCGNKDF